MAASPSSSMSLSVFMATLRIWIGSSWMLYNKTNKTRYRKCWFSRKKKRPSIQQFNMLRIFLSFNLWFFFFVLFYDRFRGWKVHLVVLLSIKNRVAPLRKGWRTGGWVRETAQHILNVPIITVTLDTQAPNLENCFIKTTWNKIHNMQWVVSVRSS